MIFHKKASFCYTNPYMQTKIIEKYFFFGLLLSTFIFTFLIFRPFWIALVLGISFSIVLYPIYEWLNNGNTGPLVDSINNTINKILPGGVIFDVNDKITDFISYISNNIANIFSTTISAFFSFILMLLIMFYFLKDGTKWKKAIVVLSPLGDKDDEKIITRLAFSVNTVIKGYLLMALVQGMFMGFGLWLFNIPNPALWGVVATVSSLLPTIGTALVSVPAIIFLFITGNTAFAIGLLIWSIIVVGMIDNFLSPLIVGKKINIPPLLILFSVFGGISLLGPVGILLGPLTVSLLYTLISIYRNEFKQNTIL